MVSFRSRISMRQPECDTCARARATGRRELPAYASEYYLPFFYLLFLFANQDIKNKDYIS